MLGEEKKDCEVPCLLSVLSDPTSWKVELPAGWTTRRTLGALPVHFVGGPTYCGNGVVSVGVEEDSGALSWLRLVVQVAIRIAWCRMERMKDSGGRLPSSVKKRRCGILVERKEGGGRRGPLPPACLDPSSPDRRCRFLRF